MKDDEKKQNATEKLKLIAKIEYEKKCRLLMDRARKLLEGDSIRLRELEDKLRDPDNVPAIEYLLNTLENTLEEIHEKKIVEELETPNSAIEVIVDKDNSHFNYIFKGIDLQTIDHDGKLMIRGKKFDKTPDGKQMYCPEDGTPHKMKPSYHLETMAVFQVWTFYHAVPLNAERCERCGKYRKLNEKGFCEECINHYKHAETQ